MTEKNNKEYMKEYYLNNKEKHLKYMMEKVKCDCGDDISRCYLSKHKKTKIHKRKLEELNLKENDNLIKKLVDFLNKNEEIKNELIEKMNISCEEEE
jgi:spore coat polysaccharide biosynthesis protein SpsF (cytidylyltransferase family)